jgi:hypothetical protein
MLAEDWDPAEYWNELAAQEGGPQLCGLFECPSGQVLWCPGDDPAVIDARDVLKDCILAASLNLAAALVLIAMTLVRGTKLCVLTANPVTLFFCLNVVYLITISSWDFALAIYGASLAQCMAAYLAAFFAAQEAACPET